MQDGRTNTETENNNQPDTTSKLVDTENIQQEKEELEYRNIDARVTEIIKNTYHKTDTKYMVEVPVPIFNWEIELKWYEKGIIFFKKTSSLPFGIKTVALVIFLLSEQTLRTFNNLIP